MSRDCAHPACSCRHDSSDMIRQDGEYYCSNHCAEASSNAQGCQCGHQDCDG